MKKLIPLVLLCAISCAVPHYDTQKYYSEYSNADGYYVYPTDDTISTPIVYIPPGNVVHSKSRRHMKYKKIYYGSHHGYVFNKGFKRHKTHYKEIPENIYVAQNKRYTSWMQSFVIPPGKKYKYNLYTPSSGGTVNVKGYYRKNGTYVRPHTRSAPHRH